MRCPQRFKKYCFAMLSISAVVPATAFAQTQLYRASTSIENTGHVASGINADYSLPAPASVATTTPGEATANFAKTSYDLYPIHLSSHLDRSSSATALPVPAENDSDYDREVSWHKLPMNILHDQKDMWLFPLQLARGRHLLPAALIAGGTAVFMATDPQVMPHFRQTTNFHGFNRVFSTTTTGVAIAVVPAVFYGVSLIRKDSYDQSSALFAGEAVVDDTILMVVTKAIARRQRPTELPVKGPYNDTFFHSNGSIFGKGTSFPSGHAMMAFSVATVFARRYREHRWVPFVAYAAASAIAFSRITTGAHFPADVFVGASLGYVIARFDVLHGQ